MNETDELRRFREEWRREVNSRLHPEQPTTSGSQASGEVTSSNVAGWTVGDQITGSVDEIRNFASAVSASESRRKALDLYAQAVQAESQGQLENALALYRRAFRLDGNVDKAYYRFSLERELTSDFGTLTIHTPARAANEKQAIRIEPSTSGPSHKKALHYHALQSLLDAFPPLSQLSFLPELENQPVYINNLPEEILVLILHYFIYDADTRSIERFALVARRARVLTLDSSIWRALVQLLYVPPQLPFSALTLSSFDEDYRYYYTHQPRVRLDGVYIAVCHYVRRGHSENAWVHITHLITYHRYLRFLPDGTVISFLSSDATASPAEIIPHLRLDDHKLKGMHTGRWKVEASATIDKKRGTSEEDDGDRPTYDGPMVIIEGLLDIGAGSATDGAGVLPKYTFTMRLGLRSKPTGRWNKLDILDYSSVHIATEEEIPLPLKHERPYWFSKVRRYGSGMDYYGI